MNNELAPELKSMFVDRRAVLKALAEHNAAVGFVPNDSVSIEQLHANMVAEGVRPEDNESTREMIARRYSQG